MKPADTTLQTLASAPPATPAVMALGDQRARGQHHFDKPQILSTVPNLPGMLQALRRRWRLALLLGLLVGAGAAAAVWYTAPERFTSRTLVYINPYEPIVSGGSGGRTDLTNFQRTQIAFIKSRLVLNAALRDPKVVAECKMIKEQIDPVLWLETQIQADFTVAPDILRIHMTGEKPLELNTLVNAVREAFLKDNAQKENNNRKKRLSKLREIYTDSEKKLLDGRSTLSRMAEELGSTRDSKAMEKTQEHVWKTLDYMLTDLMQTQSKLRRSQMDLSIKQALEEKQQEVVIPQELIEVFIKNDKKTEAFQKQLAKFDADIEQLKQSLNEPEKEPVYEQLVATRALRQKELDSHRQDLRGTLANSLRDKVQADAKAASAALQREINILKQEEEWLADAVKKRTESLKGLNKSRIDVEWLRDDNASTDELVRKMRSQINLQELELQAAQRFELMEEAMSVPNKDSRIKMAGMAGAGMFALIVLGIGFLEFRHRRVSCVDEVVRGLRMKLVGALPTLPTQRRNLALRQRQMIESVDAARTMLLHAAQTEALRLIVVTSAVGGEGKTLTSSHLAASLARAGRRTLLIDADLRRPSLQKLFNLNSQPGLSEILRGEIDFAAAVQTGPVDGLEVLTAGRNDDQAVQTLSQPVLADLFRQVKDLYEFVIVDSAPVLPVPDTELISQQADGVVFTVLQDVSRLPQVYSAYERLVMLGIPVLGVVVNGTEHHSYGPDYIYIRPVPPAANA